jgi:hypothetical protein
VVGRSVNVRDLNPVEKMTNIKCATKRCRSEADLIVCGVPLCDKHNRKRLG